MLADDKLLQPRLAPRADKRAADAIDERGAEVIIAGHGRFGMTIVRLLQANGRRTVVLDHDAEQIEALRKFGYRVYYGDAARLDLLEAAGAKDAKVFVLAIDDRDRALAIADVGAAALSAPARIRARLDRVHAYQLLNLGVHQVYREVFGTSVDVARDVLTTLGSQPFEAQRAAALFKAHDEQLVRESAAHQLDQAQAHRHQPQRARRDRERARARRRRGEARPGCAPGLRRARRRLTRSAQSRRRLDTSAAVRLSLFQITQKQLEMHLTPVMTRFILHWGEMGTRWGVNRTVAQIHALLYLAPGPLPAEEIAETLNVARSNVSTSLKELRAGASSASPTS